MLGRDGPDDPAAGPALPSGVQEEAKIRDLA